MASIGHVTKIPDGTSVKRKDGSLVKMGDEVAEGEQLVLDKPSPAFTIAWSLKAAPVADHAGPQMKPA